MFFMVECDRGKTAFIIPTNGAPATFQRMMDEVLHDMGTFTTDYIDDIVILYDSSGTLGR